MPATGSQQSGAAWRRESNAPQGAGRMVIMAEDNSSSTIEPTEPTQNGDGGTEPQGAGAPAADTTDWKAEARKWEKRAKANAKQQDSNKTADDEIASIGEGVYISVPKNLHHMSNPYSDAARAKLRGEGGPKTQ